MATAFDTNTSKLYLDDLCADLDAWQTLQLSQPPPKSSPTHSIRNVEEFSATCVLICLCTSTVNALDAAHTSSSLAYSLLSSFQPKNTAHISDLFVDRYSAAASDLISRLEFSMSMTAAWIATTRSNDDAIVDTSTLCDAWRRTCRAAIHAGDTRIADRIRLMLLAAAGGGTPCMDADGNLSIEGWAERRRSRRYLISDNATITIDGRSMDGQMIDCSETGAQLSASNPVNVNDRVVISFSDVTAAGIVRWTSGENFGIEWATRLSPTQMGLG